MEEAKSRRALLGPHSPNVQLCLRMLQHERWMRRCLQLARLGAGTSAPNPMVGAVLVQDDRILAEGWHESPGTAHAEAACLQAYGDQPVPIDAVMYVNMEPCAHQGRTGPCADLLIARGVKSVMIAHRDPFPAVNGQGIARLCAAGVRVEESLLEQEARWLNRRFLTSIEKRRPYIILKWAMSRDGYLDRETKPTRTVTRISSSETDVLVHAWRSQEQAIMAGSRTVLSDDPRLDVRLVEGRSPLRVVIDRKGIAPAGSKVFQDSRPTLLFGAEERSGIGARQVVLDDLRDPITQVLEELHGSGIRSVLVEGGATLLNRFLELGLWDEARIITGGTLCFSGTPAPRIITPPSRSLLSGPDRIDLHVNAAHQSTPADAWPW